MTGKQRAALRGMAHNMEPLLQIGKGNITEAVVKQTMELLENKELIKGSILRSSELSANEACHELAEKTGADVIQVIGNKFVIYKHSKKLEDKGLSIRLR